MAPTIRNETGQDRGDLSKAAIDRGMEQLENAKGQLAEGAERVAAAMERTADDLDGDGEGAISGFGRSVASLTRQLAGGLRERDVEEFAHELSLLARRNPGVFLAGSVALGFGIARFFKARTPSSFDGQSGRVASDAWQDGDREFGGPQYESMDRSSDADRRYDAEDGLDFSANTNSGTEPIERLDEATEDALSPTSGPEATSGGKP